MMNLLMRAVTSPREDGPCLGPQRHLEVKVHRHTRLQGRWFREFLNVLVLIKYGNKIQSRINGQKERKEKDAAETEAD